jgi:hypothetical protein
MEKNTNRVPPMKVSDEAGKRGLKLAKEQGELYKKALHHMKKVADEMEEQHAEGYLIGLAIEKAEGMYFPEEGTLVWKNPTSENAHIEISVRDAADERFIPGLTVSVTVIDSSGNEIGTHQQPFLWHPWLYHYGWNWTLPGDGVYMIKVHIDPPSFPRHDKENGLRYIQPVDVTFAKIKIKTKQQIDQP